MIQEKVKAIYSSGGKLPSGRDLITRVVIVLGRTGDLKEVQVITSSGQIALDSAAVEAFKKAATFPNPPAGMVKNEKVEIEWRFVLKT